jgi:hypothetical protein
LDWKGLCERSFLERSTLRDSFGLSVVLRVSKTVYKAFGDKPSFIARLIIQVSKFGSSIPPPLLAQNPPSALTVWRGGCRIAFLLEASNLRNTFAVERPYWCGAQVHGPKADGPVGALFFDGAGLRRVASPTARLTHLRFDSRASNHVVDLFSCAAMLLSNLTRDRFAGGSFAWRFR